MKFLNFRNWSWEVIVLAALSLWIVATFACGITSKVVTETGNALSNNFVLAGFLAFGGIVVVITRILCSRENKGNRPPFQNQGGNQNRQ